MRSIAALSRQSGAGASAEQCPPEYRTEREIRSPFSLFAARDLGPRLIPSVIDYFNISTSTKAGHLSHGTERDLETIGAIAVDEQPLSLEDALIAHVGRQGEKSFLLARG